MAVQRHQSHSVTHCRGGVGSEDDVKVKFASLNLAASGDQSVVAAVTGKKIRVLELFMSGSTGDGTILFESGTATALTGLIPFDITVPTLNNFHLKSRWGLFETAAGAALTATCATVTVDGWVKYIEI
jgi:hypothetical protein